MKNLILLLLTFQLALAMDESKQLQSNHPLQKTLQSNKLLCEMQSDIKTYLYETPLSAYTFFDNKSTELKSKSLITWVHGDIYVNTLAVSEGPNLHPLLNKEKTTHLGDYRYDIFTIMSDLLLQMQEDSDFSSSKINAILGTLIDGYFERLTNKNKKHPCIDEALRDVRKNNLIYQFTKVINKKRVFNTYLQNISKADSLQAEQIKREADRYLSEFKFLPIKDIVVDSYGDYLLLSEGPSTQLEDDIIFTLSAQILPVSYQINSKMRKDYHTKSILNKKQAIASFNKNSYAGKISINQKDFFLNKLSVNLRLKPESEETNAYKDYASALGHILASFHSNSKQKSCQDFTKKANKQVKQRLLKKEMISMVYAYNETLENRWGNFNDKKILTCN